MFNAILLVFTFLFLNACNLGGSSETQVVDHSNISETSSESGTGAYSSEEVDLNTKESVASDEAPENVIARLDRQYYLKDSIATCLPYGEDPEEGDLEFEIEWYYTDSSRLDIRNDFESVVWNIVDIYLPLDSSELDLLDYPELSGKVITCDIIAIDERGNRSGISDSFEQVFDRFAEIEE